MSALKWMGSIVGGLFALTILGLLAFGLRPSAGHVEGSIEIARSPQRIWPWMTEPGPQKEWISWLKEVRMHSDTRATWVMEDRNNNNALMEIEGEITESRPPNYSKAKLWSTGSFTGISEYKLEDIGGGRTRVTQSGDYRYEHWLARLLEPVITPAAEKKLRADLEQLKRKVEAAPAS